MAPTNDIAGRCGATTTLGLPVLRAGDDGAGEPVLLLHAFPLDRRIWAPLALALATSHRVITPDLRGFGRSIGGDVPHSIDDHADDIAALMAALGIARANVVGLSMGGYVALALLRRHAHLVARLGLADARADADSPETRRAREENIALVEHGGVPALVERMLPKLLGPDASSEVRDHVRRIGGEQTSAAVSAALRAMRDRVDATEVLRAVTVPTAIIVGAADALLSVDEARAMAALSPLATLEVIEHAGHLSPCEAPATVAATVTRLLERRS